MKKILLFLLLFALTALASNEEKVLNIYGPGYIAEYSYNVRYYMAVIGNPNCNPIGHHWTCTDLNGNPLDYIKSSAWDYEVFLDIGDQPFILNARFHYKEHGTHDEKYIYASYVVNVGEPSFSLMATNTIHNGDYDYSYGNSITRHIHFNIDSDNTGQETPDYLIGEKRFDDDDLLPLKISHSPSWMNVDYIRLKVEMPSHLRLYTKNAYQLYKPMANSGTTTNLYCGIGDLKGKIFDKFIYLEGTAIGNGNIKITYRRQSSSGDVEIANFRYRSCADIHGRQPNYNERSSLNSGYQALIDCEYSVVDDWADEYMEEQDGSYNAPAYAVDPYGNTFGHPFIVRDDCVIYGDSNCPIALDPNGKYYTSYYTFGGASDFYTDVRWPINLYPTGNIGDSIVLFYGGLLAARRSDSGNGNIGNMFIMKLNDSFFLNHNGKDFLDYYTEHPINSYTPVKYAPILEEE